VEWGVVGFLQSFAINLLKNTTYGDYASYYCKINPHLEKPFYKNHSYCSTAVNITTFKYSNNTYSNINYILLKHYYMKLFGPTSTVVQLNRSFIEK